MMHWVQLLCKGEKMPLSLRCLATGAVCGAFVILSGCSGNEAGAPASSGLVPNAVRTQAGAKKGQATIFVSDWDLDAVYVIQNGAVVQTLKVYGPQGMAVDSAGNLYVTDVAYSNVLVFAPPYTGSSSVLDDAGYRPSDVAVDANGNVAVTSFESNSYGPGSVAFYPKGATKPSKTIVANHTFAGDYFCAFDANGNLFVTSKSGYGPFAVGEVVGGIAGKSVKALTTGNILAAPAGIQVSANSRIVVLDQDQSGDYPTLYAYGEPKNGALGKPLATTAFPANDAISFAFEGKSDNYAISADTYFDAPRGRVKADHENAYGQMQIFDYPGGGGVSRVGLPLDSEPVGVAVSPLAL
jgi:hypothetical protein